MPISFGSGLWVSACLPVWHFLWQRNLLCVSVESAEWKSYRGNTSERAAARLGGKLVWSWRVRREIQTHR